MPRFRKFKMISLFARHESGLTFIETAVALAILSAISVTFLSGLTTTARAAFLFDERSTAGSLAQSQMEWVKSADYVFDAAEYTPAPLPSGKDYVNYSVTIAAEPLHNPDDGLQKITVAVKHADKEVIKLEGYKANR